MDMDAAKEEFTGSSSMIVRGKRTKRPRHPWPLSVVVSVGDIKLMTSSSSSDDDGGVDSMMSSEISTSMEEDEDMANCLILLAQSGDCPIRQVEQQDEVKMERNNTISSRRFTEMSTTTNCKVGMFVYECKTCNRSFPSFQALGGHRASHKKPKPTIEDKKISTSPDRCQISATTIKRENNDREEECHNEEGLSNSIQIPNKSSNVGNHKPKIHECSICGSEFSSGQALGGHMRRHRNIPTGNKGSIAMNNIDETNTTDESSSHDGERQRNVLELDLNLPAPAPEDDLHCHDSKFQFSSTTQKHLFSSPALVDCHY